MSMAGAANICQQKISSFNAMREHLCKLGGQIGGKTILTASNAGLKFYFSFLTTTLNFIEIRPILANLVSAVVLGKWLSGRSSRETIPTIIDISIFYHLDLHHKVQCNWIKIGRHCIVDGLCQTNLAGLWQE